MRTAPESLIERWLPIEALGVESERERAASSALPPHYFLHVWWARRPLTVSRAAVLGSLLPAWSPDWPQALLGRFPDEATYNAWVQRLFGIIGNSVTARKLIDYAKDRGIRIPNPYDSPRAFTIDPAPEDRDLIGGLLEYAWGKRAPVVLDPMAGGGSIPMESLRFGFETIANELNPVATAVLQATLEFPVQFGDSIVEDVRRFGREVAERVRHRLAPFFPHQPDESILAYLWARTVACPTTGKQIPLSPNWWLQTGVERVAVSLRVEPDLQVACFDVVKGDQASETNPNVGTVRRGTAISPWTNEIVDPDYIKREAREGRMGDQLYAVAARTQTGRVFRAPTDDDLAAVEAARAEMAASIDELRRRGLIPTEDFPLQSNDPRPIHYGMPTWADLFTPRQLLSLATTLDEVREATARAIGALGPERGRAVGTLLAFALDKVVDRNSRMATWVHQRGVIGHTFQRHDFSFRWSHSEMNMAAAGLSVDWAVDQVVDSYRGITRLLGPSQQRLWTVGGDGAKRLRVTNGNAADLGDVLSHSVDLVCVDPPYYGSVQYAELSDFFYVWLKRSVGDFYPFLAGELTDKDDEAVANPARFASFGAKRKQLANQDYERKMSAVFREMHRVLRDDGVLTVMFTHKQVEAWDALASAVIGAGFRIETSWPVRTEFSHSLHIAKKNSAESTILLVCRKRSESSEPVWWEDLKASVRQVARERAAEFLGQGIKGVDLYISAFGPALSVISEKWPVLTSELDEETRQPRVLRPETALDLAREEVISLRKEGLLLGRPVTFDPVTDWYVMAWDAFRAEEFPADEARKLAIAVGIDTMEDVLVRRERVITKKQSSVVLQQPKARRKRDIVDPDAGVYPVLIDAVHSAMLVYDEDGLPACREFLRRTGFLSDGTFRACIQALLNAIPRTRDKRGFVRPEAATLDAIRNAFFDDLVVPPEEVVQLPAATQSAFAWGGEEAVEEELEGSDDTEEE